MVNTGLRLVIGSWKTMAMSSPRTSRMSRSESRSRSRSSNITVPETMRPGGDGTSRMTASDVTVLPEPDSPTMPSISPGRTLKLTLSTTVAGPASVRNCTDSDDTLSSAPLSPGVGAVTTGASGTVGVGAGEAAPFGGWRSTVVRPSRPLIFCLPLGSPRPRASRRPSPKVLNARIVSASAMLGTNTCHGCW